MRICGVNVAGNRCTAVSASAGIDLPNNPAPSDRLGPDALRDLLADGERFVIPAAAVKDHGVGHRSAQESGSIAGDGNLRHRLAVPPQRREFQGIAVVQLRPELGVQLDRP